MIHFRHFIHALFAIVALAALNASAHAQTFKLMDGDRVVFYGDSITDQRLYTTIAETYVVTRFPDRKITFVHSGWGGDRVSGGGGGPIDLRLQRDVLAYKPTVMTIMLGMNDGGYRSYDQGIFDTYTTGYKHILDTVKAADPDVRFTFIEPSPYDDVTRDPNFPGGYNAVLLKFTDFLKDTGPSYGATLADFNTPMTTMLTTAKGIDPNLAQKILPDRVHPSYSGHLVMAEALLKAWNAPSTVTQVQIDAAGKRVVKAVNTQVTGLTSGPVISWTQNDRSLPMPIDMSDPATALVLKSSDFVAALDQEPLQVTGLKPGEYHLAIDGKDVGDYSQQELSTGVNLATQPTPMMDQAVQVMQLTKQHDDQHAIRWRQIQVPYADDTLPAMQQALPPFLAALDAEEAITVTKQYAAAQPVAHAYTLTATLPPTTGSNLALNKTYVCSDPNTYGFGTGGLTDGSWDLANPHIFASGDNATFPKTVTVDLQQASQVGNIVIGVPPFGSTKTVIASVSLDGQTFTDVGTTVFSQNKEERHRYSFAPVSARYVRLTYPDHYDDQVQYPATFVFTSELEVYGP